MSEFQKWTSLNAFHEVVKNLNYRRAHEALVQHGHKINFGFKIKLHGTNACVRVDSTGKVTGQKRSGDVSVERDNAGFADWVSRNEAYFASLAYPGSTHYIYGEWCGPGIQKNVSCSLTDRKYFYPFAIDEVSEGNHCRVYEPKSLEDILGVNCPDTILVLPWHMKMTFDLTDEVTTRADMALLNEEVEAIGKCDPFIKEIFDIEGCGEGLVAFPLMGDLPGVYVGSSELEYFSWFNFKAKSEDHRVNKTKNAVNFNPEAFATNNRFADAYCTDQRMEQGLKEALEGELSLKRIPDFIKWVVQDIFKESATEREASQLEWKGLSRACSGRAAEWYKRRVTAI